MTFKEPLQINYDDEPEVILAQVMEAIEQAENFRFKFDNKNDGK